MKPEQDHFDHLRDLLVEQFDIPATQIRPEARLYDDLGIDSIDAVDMIVHLRSVTGERIAPERFKAARTVQDVIDIVDEMTTRRAS